MLNAFFNVKTAEKTLQFGTKKCKTMVVGKNVESIHFSKLSVDQWKVEHKEDDNSVETFMGKVEIDHCEEKKYLGFIISNSDDNMANIRNIRNRSYGAVRTIFQKLNSLNLRKYYFECGMIFLKVMLRSSILYGSETYYNLKEGEIRALERIEEGFMRQLLKTTKGCPIVQMYLDLGHIPARFDIMKLRLFFLKTILDQEKSSLISKFFYLQYENPTKSDWATTCCNNLKEMNIQLTLKELKDMKAEKYRELIREKCIELAYQYLMKKRGKKGIEIKYQKIQMAQYLSPNNIFEIKDQTKIFEMRNKMTNIPANFSGKSEKSCICGEIESMNHIYVCKKLNKEEIEVKYENIYESNLKNMKMIVNRFEANMKEREKEHHAIQNCDPPVSVIYRAGNG